MSSAVIWEQLYRLRVFRRIKKEAPTWISGKVIRWIAIGPRRESGGWHICLPIYVIPTSYQLSRGCRGMHSKTRILHSGSGIQMATKPQSLGQWILVVQCSEHSSFFSANASRNEPTSPSFLSTLVKEDMFLQKPRYNYKDPAHKLLPNKIRRCQKVPRWWWFYASLCTLPRSLTVFKEQVLPDQCHGWDERWGIIVCVQVISDSTQRAQHFGNTSSC